MLLERGVVTTRLSVIERLDVAAVPGAAERHAAVVIVLHEASPGETAFILTKRARSLRSHAGQWAIPGGRLEPGESPVQAALRELQEEVGVQALESDVLGMLDDFVSRSGYRITPVVAWLDAGPLPLVAVDAEVAELHVVPISEIDVDPVLVPTDDPLRPIIQIPMRSSRIHAPTGAILYQLREVVLHGRPTRVAHFEQPAFAHR